MQQVNELMYYEYTVAFSDNLTKNLMSVFLCSLSVDLNLNLEGFFPTVALA